MLWIITNDGYFVIFSSHVSVGGTQILNWRQKVIRTIQLSTTILIYWKPPYHGPYGPYGAGYKLYHIIKHCKFLDPKGCILAFIST